MLSFRQASEDETEAQDLLREMIDTLPHEIALVDDGGIVTGVNLQWALANAALSTEVKRLSRGDNAVETLRAAAARGDEAASRLAAGVASVLAGAAAFHFDYPFEEKGSTRWFAVDVRSMRDARQGALLCRSDITAQSERLIAALDLSERRESRRALELQAVLDTAPIGLAIALDPHGERIRGNPALEEMTGVAPGDELSKSAHRPASYRVFRNGREAPTRDLPMQRAVSGEAVGGEILEILREDGGRRTAFATAMPLYDEAGAPRGAVGAFMDITKLKQAEDALRESERRFRSLVEAYAQAVWETDADGAVVADSPSWRAYSGQTATAWREGGWLAAIHPDDRDAALLRWRAAVAQGRRFEVEARLQNASGGWRWSDLRATPVRAPDGAIVAWTGMAMDIDARKQAEEALRASEERYRTLFETIDEGFCIVEILFDAAGEARDCHFLEANPAFVKHSGLRDAVGRTLRELADVKDSPWLRILAGVARTGKPARHQDSSTSLGRYFDVFAFRLGPPAANRVAVLFTDITARRAADERLRESEFQLQLALDSGNIGIYEWRLPTNEFMWDDRLRAQWGLSPGKAMTYEMFIEGIHPEDRGRVQGEIDRAFDPVSGGAIAAEFRVVGAPDRTERWIAITGTAFFEEGRAVRMVGTAQDVTARKRVEIERQKFVSLAEQSVEFIGICNLAFEPRYINPEGVRLLGLASPDAVKQVNVADVFFPEDHPFLFETFFPKVLREGSANTEIRFRRFDTGEPVWMLYNVFLLRDPVGAPIGLATVSRDITLKRRAEEALREADRRKDEFLATLAHELRNPLAPIRAATYVLRRDARSAEPGDRDTRLLSMIDRQSEHLVRLVDDLLEVSRITRGKIELRKQRVDLNAILRHAVETAEPTISAGRHRLDLRLLQQGAPVDADPVRLAQVFTNLLNNAAKYTENGGRIDVVAELSGDEAVVTVRDSGVGIPAEMLPRVFDLFTQVDRTLGRAQGGLGIGLALVKRLVELHGGSVEANSDGLGRGSAFVVRLRLVAEDGAKIPMSNSVTHEPPASRRVLVIDDDHDVADSLVMFLETFGANVRVAYSGEGGVEAVREFRPELIFLDLGMPKIDGYETARRIRALPEGRDVKLVALTGWGQGQIRERAHDAGFDCQLTKPAGIDALQALLNAV
jgi:PAS domain S-box-containing protein